VGIRAPVIGAILWVPLTSEFPDEFSSRVNALPRWLYDDTPPEGDRDKLQHFFGSALVTLLFESPETAQRIGDFVEWGEEAFILGGVSDERDKRANVNGQRFGMNLLEGLNVRPSVFFDSGR
jgi:hypothetical protein